jgi:glutaredoxin
MVKHLILFTMEGCPHCHDFKNILRENSINYVDLDINENPEEYEMFSKITENDLVPAFMIVDETNNSAEYFAPDRDYNELDEALEILKRKL